MESNDRQMNMTQTISWALRVLELRPNFSRAQLKASRDRKIHRLDEIIKELNLNENTIEREAIIDAYKILKTYHRQTHGSTMRNWGSNAKKGITRMFTARRLSNRSLANQSLANQSLANQTVRYRFAESPLYQSRLESMLDTRLESRSRGTSRKRNVTRSDYTLEFITPSANPHLTMIELRQRALTVLGLDNTKYQPSQTILNAYNKTDSFQINPVYAAAFAMLYYKPGTEGRSKRHVEQIINDHEKKHTTSLRNRGLSNIEYKTSVGNRRGTNIPRINTTAGEIIFNLLFTGASMFGT